jgi:hypothetical protein
MLDPTAAYRYEPRALALRERAVMVVRHASAANESDAQRLRMQGTPPLAI